MPSWADPVILSAILAVIGVLIRMSFNQLTQGLNELKDAVQALVGRVGEVVTDAAISKNDISWLKDLHAEGSKHRKEG